MLVQRSVNYTELPKMYQAQGLAMQAAWARVHRAAPKRVPPYIGDTTADIYLALMIMDPDGMGRRSPEANREIADLMAHQMRWAKYGCPIFNLSHSILAAFLLTDCSGVKGRDIRFPFPNFLVRLPAGPSCASIANNMTNKIEPVKLITVDIYRGSFPKLCDDIISPNGEENLIDFTTALDRGLEGALDLYDQMKKNYPEDESEDASFLRAIGETGISTYMSARLPHEDEPIGGWLAGERGGSRFGEDYPIQLENVDKMGVQTCTRIIANLCLYLQEMRAHADHKLRFDHKKPHNARSEPRDAETPPPLLWCVGNEIKLDRTIREAAMKASAVGGAHAVWKLKSQLNVIGHYKSQPHGPKNSLRKTIWVKPYRKGPEDGVGVLKRYAAGTGQTTSDK